MKLLQRLDQQIVDREPDRPAPVGVAAEQAAVGLGRHVLDAQPMAAVIEHDRVAARGTWRARARRSRTGTRSRPACACSSIFMRWPRSSESSRRSPRPGSSQCETSWASSRPVGRGTSRAGAAKSGSLARCSGSRVSTAKSGIRPTIERTRSGMISPSGRLQLVVEELVGLVPQPDVLAADVGHRLGDVEEVLEELGRDVLVGVVVLGELERDPHQVQAVHRHPGGAVGLVDEAAGRQRRRAVEHADVVEPEEAALEDVAALGVLAVHPPGEVQHQLVEDALEEARCRPSRRRAACGRSGTRARPPRRAPAG